jgi:CRISPR-associated endonuclease Cas2
METVFVIVCYDIPDTKVRNRLVYFLLSRGLSRVQLSVFSGEIPVSRAAPLTRELRQDFPKENEKILIVLLCKTCVSNIVHLHDTIPTRPPSYIVL